MIGLTIEFKTANEKAMKNISLYSSCEMSIIVSTANGPENRYRANKRIETNFIESIIFLLVLIPFSYFDRVQADFSKLADMLRCLIFRLYIARL